MQLMRAALNSATDNYDKRDKGLERKRSVIVDAGGRLYEVSLLPQDYTTVSTHEVVEWREARLPNVIQVFGHTLQDNGPRVIGDAVYCLDCKRGFVLNESGVIEQI